MWREDAFIHDTRKMRWGALVSGFGSGAESLSCVPEGV